jgi:hypothetical protein
VFSPEYKHAVLEEYDRLTELGAKGAFAPGRPALLASD